MSADRATHVFSPMALDVAAGLSSRPKTLSPKYFYDAVGSMLFDEITRLPEYYLTETEHSILTANAREILKAAADAHIDAPPSDELTVLELGAGSATKTITILRELQTLQDRCVFIPIDVSQSALEEAVTRIGEELPLVNVRPEVLDYTQSLAGLEQIEGRKLVLYIGSSIGNFEPFHAGSLLRNVHAALNPGDALLLGTDMRKPEDVLLPAYDDRRGITAAFNKNILSHINRELNADFDLESFQHRAIWNSSQSRIEMHLESLRTQIVSIPALNMNVHFARGETIHTENSYKFTMPMIEAIANNGGFSLEHTWSDPREWFTVHLLRA
jgi:L-histidine N-alpha-methyltransferase